MVGSKDRYDVCMQAAGVALAAGERADAERSLRGAIEAIESFSDFHAEMSSALVRLASLKQETGSYSEAEEIFRRALDVSERALGSHDVGLVPALTGIGAARIMQGSPDQAQPFLARALELSERHLGDAHPDLIILLNDLTRLYLKQSAFEYAEPLLLRLLALKRTKGEDHPEVATVLASLATVRQSLGRYESAEQLWRRVLEIRERTLAPNHFSLATTLEHLAGTCAARGKSHEALRLYQRALSIRELTLGADHASLRASRERIADLQLQAAEDSFDDTAALPPSPLRLSPGERLGPPPSATIVNEAPPPVAPPPSREILAERAPMSAPRDPRPTMEREPRTNATAGKSGALAFEPLLPSTPPARVTEPARSAEPGATAEDPPYLKVLLEIKDEIEQTEALERTAEHRGETERAGWLVAVGDTIKTHRRAAAIVAVGVISLPLVAMGMVSVARSNALAARQEQAVVVPAAPLTDSVALAASLAARVALDAQKDSIAAAAVSSTKSSASRSRPSEETPRRASAEDSSVTVPSWIPTISRSSVVRLDSVVGAMASSRPSDASMIQLASSSDPRPSATEGETNAPQRARLIGALPTPRYPAQLLLSRVGGEVVVRFQVDTTGRPVMNTFSVVSSPDAAFTAAVRRVIPTMRFEPARSPGPEFKAITDVMEIGFRFSPDAR